MGGRVQGFGSCELQPRRNSRRGGLDGMRPRSVMTHQAHFKTHPRLWRAGFGIHLIKGSPRSSRDRPIEPKSDHLSFLVRVWCIWHEKNSCTGGQNSACIGFQCPDRFLIPGE